MLQKIKFLNSLILIFSHFICTTTICQEIAHIFEHEEITLHDPWQANKYYFSVLPSSLNFLVLSYYDTEFHLTKHLIDRSHLLSTRIARALTTKKMDNATLWGSFNILLYEQALFTTAFSGGCLISAKIYLGRSKDPTYSRGKYESNSPLELATSHNYPNVVELLLKAGADPNQSTCFEDSPLSIAVHKNHVECVRLLLAHRAGAR